MRIALLGDLAFFGKFSLENNNELFNYFKDISNKLKEYDLVIGNLETPFVNNDIHNEFGYKSAYIKSNSINVELLKYLNITIVNLSNNHIFDYGKGAYEYTKKILRENNIQYFGIENKSLQVKKGNNVIKFDGFCCYSTNPLGIHSEKVDGINDLNIPIIEKKLKINTEEGSISIFSMHCGQEHVNYPNYDHIEFARKLSTIGQYVFYGHHPHVAQGIEKINDSIIAYSIGNFCFDDVYTNKSSSPLIKQSENNKESFILELSLENNKIKNYETIPIYMGDNSMVLYKNDILNKIDIYSEKLKTPKNDYINFRNKLLDDYILKRKKLRDINWYLKRLNYKSIFMILNSKLNSKKYYNKVKKHL